MGCQRCHFTSSAEGACTSLSKVLVLSDHWVAFGNVVWNEDLGLYLLGRQNSSRTCRGDSSFEDELSLLHYIGTSSTIHNPRMALNFQNAGQGITLNLTKVL